MFVDWYMNQSQDGTWRDWIVGKDKKINGVPGGPNGTPWPQNLIEPGLNAIDAWLKATPTVLPCRGVDWAPPEN